MLVATWNINSIRARIGRLTGFLDRHQPDLVCLQETKVEDLLFPHDAVAAAGYRAHTFGQPTYNGVAFLVRDGAGDLGELEDVATGFAGDPIPDQARVIGATLNGVRFVNVYVPNGQAPGTDKFTTKLAWLEALRTDLAARHTPSDPVLMLGDFNVAPDDRDVHDPKRWAGKVHCTDDERARLAALTDWGLTDLLRLHHDEAGIHTWWDYRMGAFARGWGLRIDLALGTAPVAARCRDVTVDRDERKKGDGEENPSDHAPVLVHFDE